MNSMVSLQAKLKLLSNAYAVQLPEKLQEITQTWNKLSQAQWDHESYKAMHCMVHSLSGSGRTFAFSALSEAARNLEKYLKHIGETTQVLGTEQRDQVNGLLAELKNSLNQQDKPGDNEQGETIPAGDTAVLAKRVFVVEDDVQLAEELKTQLSYFGYQVSVFHTLNEFRSFMRLKPNGIVLMDINFPKDGLSGVQLMTELQQDRSVPLPLIFLSAYGEMDLRLAAVQAGSLAYLTKPVNMCVLTDKLDELTETGIVQTPRVLIVDDSATLASCFAAILERSGMHVKVVNDPLEALQPLFEFVPDLILIDMYMPGCNGMELAKIIRQIDAFISIPIIFLSGEIDQDKQRLAIELGVDDFLAKPIDALKLISSVKSRIRRSQLLRSFMVRDSLTGLLNHTAIKEQLAREIARAKRQAKPLVLAMIDIDHFKLVNDGYGHHVGDSVIKSLSRLLKQRLRETDLVGRYGSEALAVIMLDTDGVRCREILDNIRNDFAHLRHLAGTQEFTVTFSGGIAMISCDTDAAQLLDAANKALSVAKLAGRNQLSLADLQHG